MLAVETYRDFDNFVSLGVESCHFTVDPDEWTIVPVESSHTSLVCSEAPVCVSREDSNRNKTSDPFGLLSVYYTSSEAATSSQHKPIIRSSKIGSSQLSSEFKELLFLRRHRKD